MHSVAFICSANLCRSLMAHAIFAAEAKRRRLDVNVQSAGMFDFEGVLALREARFVCERHNTPMPKFVSSYFRNLNLSGVTRVFAMTEDHVTLLQAETDIPPERISLLGLFDPKQRGDEIEDPTGKDSQAFDQCYQQLWNCIVHYLDSTDELS